jgi:hypothetical protein
VALNWSCKLRELQIMPTFPPREDIQVGDLYVRTFDSSVDASDEYCDPASLVDFVSIPLHVGTVSGIGDALETYYRTRLDAPKTEQGQLSILNGDAGVSGFRVPESSDGSVFKSTNVRRMRQVGFPDFMSVRVSGAELGAIVPIHGVMSDLGFGIEAVESASISVPVAESYGLPANVLLALLINGEKPVLDHGESCTEDGHYATVSGLTYDELVSAAPLRTQRNSRILPQSPSDPVLLLTVVREVFATRAIDSSIGFKQSFVAGLNRDRSSEAKSEPRSSDISGESKDNAAPVGPAEAKLRDDMRSLATAAGEALAARQSVPGITLNVRSGSNHGVGLTRVFDRPVVIGYREISFTIKRAAAHGCAEVMLTGATSKQLTAIGR